MRVEELAPQHLPDLLDLQRTQAYVPPGSIEELIAAASGGWVGVVDGRVVAAAGVLRTPHWPERWAWALGTTRLARHGLPFARHIRRWLDLCTFRLDTSIDPSCEPELRWMAWIGFARVGPMPWPREDGLVADLYRREPRHGH